MITKKNIMIDELSCVAGGLLVPCDEERNEMQIRDDVTGKLLDFTYGPWESMEMRARQLGVSAEYISREEFSRRFGDNVDKVRCLHS